MRMSDCSSDVCSSDLNGSRPNRLRETEFACFLEALLPGFDDVLDRVRDVEREQVDERLALRVERLDRKSVVSGKSVPVRVDLGGRRIITKKELISNPHV